MRLARGGSKDDSARMSLSSGGSPSTLVVPPRGRERRLAAKARAAAKESRADQRAAKAETGTAGGSRGGARAEAREKSDKGGSFSAPAATELESEDDKLASRRLSELWVGALLGFARDSGCSAGSADLRGAPAEVTGETRVVSTASCAPPQSASPLAMTSMRRSSCRAASTLRSRSRTLRATVALTSSADAGSSALEGPAPSIHEGRLTEDMLRGGRRKVMHGQAVAGSGNALQSRAGAGAGAAGGGATRGRTAS